MPRLRGRLSRADRSGRWRERAADLFGGADVHGLERGGPRRVCGGVEEGRLVIGADLGWGAA